MSLQRMVNWHLLNILDMLLRMRRNNSNIRLSHWHELLRRELWDWAMHHDLIAIGHEVNGNWLDILSVNTVMIEAKVDPLLSLVDHLRRKRIASKLLSLHRNLMLLMLILLMLLMLLCLIPCDFFNVSLLEIALMPAINLLQVLVDPRVSVENLQSLSVVIAALAMHIGAEGRLRLKRASRSRRAFMMVNFRQAAGLAQVPLGEHIKTWYFFHFYFLNIVYNFISWIICG